MQKNDLRIDILGTSISISANEDPGYLERLLEKYRQTIGNVQRSSGLSDPLKTAILTGFLLCDDLEKALAAGGTVSRNDQADSGEAELLTMGMISRLDELVSEPDRGDGAPETSESGAGKIYKLINTVKNYEWGSPEWIPDLLGRKNYGRVPCAEIWMGVNPAGPSRAVAADEAGDAHEPGIKIADLIAQAPAAFLGTENAARFGSLPFLFKLEAAAKPLSIQAHPNSRQATEGFDRENKEGISLEAPDRNYRDPRHKPEIICALSAFEALCGFRNADEAAELLEELALGFSIEQPGGAGPDYDQASEIALKAGLQKAISALGGENPHRDFLDSLFSMGTQVLRALGPFIRSHAQALAEEFPEHACEWELCSYLAGLYPADPGILAPLFLNFMELAPGEAMYIPPGVLHSYLHGMGIELMADSDNVLRGGLSSKYVDPVELLRVLEFSEWKPEIIKAPSSSSWYSYPSPAGEFSLSVMRGAGESITYPEPGPSIVMITQGSAEAVEGDIEMKLYRGDSIFIPAGKGEKIRFRGTFTAYAASVGKKAADSANEDFC